MAYDGLQDFIEALEQDSELKRISTFVNPELEITEIADRVYKNKGPALLFENTGTAFPLLINMYGSDLRMSKALGRSDLEDAGKEIESLFTQLKSQGKGGVFSKLAILPRLFKIASLMPKKIKGRGPCQQNIMSEPDLDKLPVLKCWPHDGGRFITLPVVHTRNPLTGELNAGMYRMQILDRKTTGMHWHRHKTGANHFQEYKKLGMTMPVAVTLGGDPVYTYCATAPLPEGIDEYILAGFLRGKKVKQVKCITQDLYVPEDADIVIEGYIDPSEDLVWEGPFGDHTGFYSLADWYPGFHVTAITYRNNAVYPATIVGIPPQEDAVIGLATERLFLYPVKLSMQPDIIDFHMPSPGVAHNLVLVKIDKTYPGQGLKVINSLFGAGQMMFSKFIVVVDKDTDLRDYQDIALRVIENCNFRSDVIVQMGPLDVLDHSSDSFSYGGKMGIDATVKLSEEAVSVAEESESKSLKADISAFSSLVSINSSINKQEDLPVAIVGVDKSLNWKNELEKFAEESAFKYIFALDAGVDVNKLYTCAWQILANTDPRRDIYHHKSSLIINSTAKAHPSDRFPRLWPNVVVSDNATIDRIDRIWQELDLGEKTASPSREFASLLFKGGAEISR
ncbi:MAG: menaquinone biosynthesis decarboxylase [Marinilabiliaceae bacterium]|jgi:4-hydroxy-3-polyprenylbenzoate decarboxylase|nr:menaquinone biosynthesis decarboxylase [Marinilabiliaceae bacterium]